MSKFFLECEPDATSITYELSSEEMSDLQLLTNLLGVYNEGKHSSIVINYDCKDYITKALGILTHFNNDFKLNFIMNSINHDNIKSSIEKRSDGVHIDLHILDTTYREQKIYNDSSSVEKILNKTALFSIDNSISLNEDNIKKKYILYIKKDSNEFQTEINIIALQESNILISLSDLIIVKDMQLFLLEHLKMSLSNINNNLLIPINLFMSNFVSIEEKK